MSVHRLPACKPAFFFGALMSLVDDEAKAKAALAKSESWIAQNPGKALAVAGTLVLIGLISYFVL